MSVLFQRLANAVINVIKSEAALNSICRVLVSQSVHVVIVTHEQTCASLFKALWIVVMIFHINDMEVFIISENHQPRVFLDSNGGVQFSFNKRSFFPIFFFEALVHPNILAAFE